MNRKYLYYVFPLLGTVLVLWYVFSATCDGIYSDYVRLVNSYLPDVWNPKKFFVPDIFTRIPVNYLGRISNAALFGYNTMFDRVLGVLALGSSGLVMAIYCLRRKISFGWFFLLMAVLFSLNKWEMLDNGSGWTHFLSFVCFYFHYELLDRAWSGQKRRQDHILLMVLPFVTTLMIAGPYCAIYSVTVLMACGFMYLSNKRGEKRNFLLYGICTLIPFLLYLWSNSYAVEDHAAPAEVSLFTQLKETPGFFLRFFVKSFSSMAIGGEQAEVLFHTNAPYMVLGLLVMILYALALWYNWRFRLYKETLFPLMLLASGGLNHLLIVLSRWIFLLENYGLSSRYALQFQTGIFGILLTFALALKKKNIRKNLLLRIAAVLACGLFLLGNSYTTWKEVEKAPLRKGIYETRARLAIDFEQHTDDELRSGFEYRVGRPDSGEKVRSALTILKENGYSVFRPGFTLE